MDSFIYNIKLMTGFQKISLEANNRGFQTRHGTTTQHDNQLKEI